MRGTFRKFRLLAVFKGDREFVEKVVVCAKEGSGILRAWMFWVWAWCA